MPKGKHIPFTINDISFIKRNYLKMPVKTLAGKLNVSGARIMRFLEKNNLKIPREIVEKRIAESRFKKGNTPINKGKKQIDYMSKQGIENSKKTRFKKGNTPFNCKKNFTISERKDTDSLVYKYIKLSNKNWELYHRYLYRTNVGPIPDNHVVVFKDGNSLNTDLSNLELISVEEHMLRNSHANYPKEIIPSMALKSRITKKIKQLTNGKK